MAFNNSWRREKGLLPSLSGADAAGTNYGKTSTFPNYSISGNLDYVPTLLYALKRRGLKRGIAALCLGGGNGVALAIEMI